MWNVLSILRYKIIVTHPSYLHHEPTPKICLFFIFFSQWFPTLLALLRAFPLGIWSYSLLLQLLHSHKVNAKSTFPKCRLCIFFTQKKLSYVVVMFSLDPKFYVCLYGKRNGIMIYKFVLQLWIQSSHLGIQIATTYLNLSKKRANKYLTFQNAKDGAVAIN